MNSEDMCNEISQIQILHNFTYMSYLKKLNLQKKRRNMVTICWGKDGIGNYTLEITQFQCERMKKIWRWVMVVVV